MGGQIVKKVNIVLGHHTVTIILRMKQPCIISIGIEVNFKWRILRGDATFLYSWRVIIFKKQTASWRFNWIILILRDKYVCAQILYIRCWKLFIIAYYRYTKHFNARRVVKWTRRFFIFITFIVSNDDSLENYKQYYKFRTKKIVYNNSQEDVCKRKTRAIKFRYIVHSKRGR